MNGISGGGSSPFQMSLEDVLFLGFSIVSTSSQQLLTDHLDSYTKRFYTLRMLIIFIRYVQEHTEDPEEQRRWREDMKDLLDRPTLNFSLISKRLL